MWCVAVVTWLLLGPISGQETVPLLLPGERQSLFFLGLRGSGELSSVLTPHEPTPDFRSVDFSLDSSGSYLAELGIRLIYRQVRTVTGKGFTFFQQQRHHGTRHSSRRLYLGQMRPLNECIYY
jgi:hypothetical protein